MSEIIVGFAKMGNIGSAPLIEFILDERAEREDIDVTVVGSGAKILSKQTKRVAKTVVDLGPNFIVMTTPNASLKSPMEAMEIFKEAQIPTVVISDSPAKKATGKIEEMGLGYIIVESDAMIGARKEFLDPVEMGLFNADIIKVLAITGVFNILSKKIDGIIESFKLNKKPNLPRVIIDRELSISAANFQNPYAKAKALAAFELAKQVGKLNVEGCFMQKEWEQYTNTVASAHEIMRAAANLADEARELEKSNDSVFRTPHSSSGNLLQKRKLIEKPKKS